MAAEQAAIDAVPEPPEGLQPDCLLRISSPFRSAITPGQRTLTFMVTECGLVDDCFDAPPVDPQAFTRDDNRIITPSAWSRDRLVDGGMAKVGGAGFPQAPFSQRDCISR